MPGGRKPYKHILQHFAYTIIDDAKKQKATCKLCNKYKLIAYNPTCKAKHLEECKGYKELEKHEEEQKSIKRQRVLDDSIVIRIPSKRKAKIDEELASCLYQTGKLFDLFDNNCWIQFFKRNFGYILLL
jgi:hypothetical protein